MSLCEISFGHVVPFKATYFFVLPSSVHKSKWVKVRHGGLGLTLQANFKRARRQLRKLLEIAPDGLFFGASTFVFVGICGEV